MSSFSALEDVAEMDIMYPSTDLVDSFPSGSNSKDEHVKEEIDEDRISKLPDVLLGQILSLLPSKFAVETCTLSKRWEHLWTLVDNCELDDTLYSSSASLDIPKTFIDFGNNFFRHSCVNTICKFHLTCVEQQCDVSSLHTWICTAVSLNAQEIVVEISGTDPFELSESVFTCKMLRVLKIKAGFVVNILTLVNLPNLKILHLCFPIFFVDDDPMEKLLPGCKILEELSLEGVTIMNLQRLCIRSSSLKRLRVKDCTSLADLSRYTLVIDARQLEHLQIEDVNLKCVEANEMPHLHEANIMVTPCLQGHEMSEELARSFFQLFQKISNVKHLKLTWNIDMHILQSVYQMLQYFKNLTSMEISIYEYWHLMALLLECAPNLKVLICEKVSRCYTNRERHRRSSLCQWLPPRHVPKCMSGLSEIEMRINGCENELQVAGFLLNNATALRTMRIGRATHYVKKWEDNILADLLNFSRGSTACEVEFP